MAKKKYNTTEYPNAYGQRTLVKTVLIIIFLTIAGTIIMTYLQTGTVKVPKISLPSAPVCNKVGVQAIAKDSHGNVYAQSIYRQFYEWTAGEWREMKNPPATVNELKSEITINTNFGTFTKMQDGFAIMHGSENTFLCG